MLYIWKLTYNVLVLDQKVISLRFVVALYLIASSASFLFWMMQHPQTVQAHTRFTPPTGEYIDAVIILDNVAQIGPHDRNGDRFSAARLFIDLALPGDNIGLLKIPSLSDESMQKARLTRMDDGGKSTLKRALAPENFGIVQSNDTAFFTPALQYAGNILNHSNRPQRYVIVVTDSAALSGDTNACPGAPQFQNWLCAVQSLEEQHIAIVFVTFLAQGDEGEFAQTSKELEQYGHTVPLKVQDDNSSFPRQLAEKYTEILSDVHPNVFKTNVIDSKTQKVNIDQRLQLESLTFVALGTARVSAHLLNPLGHDTANDPDTYEGGGSIYWLRTIQATDLRGTNLDGTWRITPDSATVQGWIVIAVAQARLQLRDPTPSDVNNEISPRYVPFQGQIILRASVKDSNGIPLLSVPFAVNQPGGSSTPLVHEWPALPGGENADVTALFPLDFQQSQSSESLPIGLGAPLTTSGQTETYFTKTFSLEAHLELNTIKVVPPPKPTPPFPMKGTALEVRAEIVNGPIAKTTIYSRSASDRSWQALPTSNNNGEADAFFKPDYGCGFLYTLAAIEQIGGTLDGNQPYEYLAYNTQQYPSYLAETIELSEKTSSETVLPLWSWWSSSQINMTVTLTSQACTNQIPQLHLNIQGTGSQVPHATFQTGPDYVLQKGNAAVETPANNQKTAQLRIDIAACSVQWGDDEKVILMLSALPQESTVPISGQVQSTAICPSVRRYPVLIMSVGILSLIALLNIFFRTRNALFPVRSYLDGHIEYLTNYESKMQSVAPVPVSIPTQHHLAEWYLDYVQGSYEMPSRMLCIGEEQASMET